MASISITKLSTQKPPTAIDRDHGSEKHYRNTGDFYFWSILKFSFLLRIIYLPTTGGSRRSLRQLPRVVHVNGLQQLASSRGASCQVYHATTPSSLLFLGSTPVTDNFIYRLVQNQTWRFAAHVRFLSQIKWLQWSLYKVDIHRKSKNAYNKEVSTIKEILK